MRGSVCGVPDFDIIVVLYIYVHVKREREREREREHGLRDTRAEAIGRCLSLAFL